MQRSVVWTVSHLAAHFAWHGRCSTPSGMGGRVLVVDDERTLLFAIRDYFDAIGIVVDCALTADQASELCRSRHYRVAIIDLRLGGIDDFSGVEVAESIRTLQPHVRIVVLTAFGTEDVRRRLENLGVDCYLKKPQPLAVLARAVTELVGCTGGV